MFHIGDIKSKTKNFRNTTFCMVSDLSILYSKISPSRGYESTRYHVKRRERCMQSNQTKICRLLIFSLYYGQCYERYTLCFVNPSLLVTSPLHFLILLPFQMDLSFTRIKQWSRSSKDPPVIFRH